MIADGPYPDPGQEHPAEPEVGVGPKLGTTTERGARRDVGVGPDDDVVLDHGPGVDDHALAYPGIGVDHRAGHDHGAPPQSRTAFVGRLRDTSAASQSYPPNMKSEMFSSIAFMSPCRLPPLSIANSPE